MEVCAYKNLVMRFGQGKQEEVKIMFDNKKGDKK